MDLHQFKFIKYLLSYKRKVYLDYNATSPVSKNVQRKMRNVINKYYGNPSSVYSAARESSEVIDEARMQLARVINADHHEIYFTGCATESNNAILKSVSSHFYPERKKIISTPIEHSSIISTLEYLKVRGIEVVYCPVDCKGRVVLSELERLVDDQTFLICCMMANNEIGTIQDIKAIVQIAKKNNVLVMSDCVQALGKIKIDIKETGLDYASFSAHKVHGPKGCGALFIKKGSPFIPFLHGGHQERGIRAGTESVHDIAGFGEACKEIGKCIDTTKKINNLKVHLINKIKKEIPDCILNSPAENCLPNTVSMRFKNISNTELMGMMDYYGIAVSAGSACNSMADKPSSTLKAIGLSDQAAQETIRFSLGKDTNRKDIDYTARMIRLYKKGRGQYITMIPPSKVDELFLHNHNNFIIDVRPNFMRTVIKSLPNSLETSILSIERYLKQIPKDKNILVVCQHGNLSHIEAYYLKSRGYDLVSSLQGGICAWKKHHEKLYLKYNGSLTAKD